MKATVELQKMVYRNPDDHSEINEVVCAINTIQMGGEYTLCGVAIPDTTLNNDDCYHVGDCYVGSKKDITCEACLAFINFIQGIK